MKRKNTLHIDSGHGWLEVTLQDLCILNVSDVISQYSYVDASKCHSIKVYLEEDCDLAKYLQAYVNAYGQEPKIEIKYYEGECFIRELAQFNGKLPSIGILQKMYQNLNQLQTNK